VRGRSFLLFLLSLAIGSFGSGRGFSFLPLLASAATFAAFLGGFFFLRQGDSFAIRRLSSFATFARFASRSASASRGAAASSATATAAATATSASASSGAAASSRRRAGHFASDGGQHDGRLFGGGLGGLDHLLQISRQLLGREGFVALVAPQFFFSSHL
jgi:hypothetical protein